MPNREAHLGSSTLAVLILLIPRVAPAQPIANSFEELRWVLKKGQILYAAPRQEQRLRISPVLGKDRQGVMVSISF